LAPALGLRAGRAGPLILAQTTLAEVLRTRSSLLFRSLLMFLLHALRDMMSHPTARRRRRRNLPDRRLHNRRLILELLEDRFCPSGGYLLISSANTDSMLRYDEHTGGFIDAFVPSKG